MLHFTCPSCHAGLRAPSEMPAPARVRCPKCGAHFVGTGARTRPPVETASAPPASRPGGRKALLWGLAGAGAALALVLAGAVLSNVIRTTPKPEAGRQLAAAPTAAGEPTTAAPAAAPSGAPADGPPAPGPAASTTAEDKKGAGEPPSPPSATAGPDKKMPPEPPPAPPDKKPDIPPPDKPAPPEPPPPLPHTDRPDDPTVLVPGDPPLTQGALDRYLDLWEWALDLRLTDQQRAQWQRGWTDAFAKKDDNARAQTLAHIRANVQSWDGMAKLGPLQRDLWRFQLQPSALALLRKSAEAEDKLLLGLHDAAHRPGGERNPILVASDPPLTQDMMDLYRTAMDYVLDIRMTDGQRDEFQKLVVEDWKKNDPKQWAKNIESWRRNLAMRTYARRVWRAQAQSLQLDSVRKLELDSDRWLLPAYEKAHQPGGRRNPVLVDGDPSLTRDLVDQYCDMVEGLLDFSVSGGLTDGQRQDLEDLLVKDWKGMNQRAKEDFLKTLQNWPSQDRLLAQLRAASSGDQRSQYLLGIHDKEVAKAAQQAKDQQMQFDAMQFIISQMGAGRGHFRYNPATGRNEWAYDP